MDRSRMAIGVLVGLLAAAAGLFLWWSMADAPPGAERLPAALGSERPNVVLVTIDTLRADRLGSYGSDVATPHLDRLAREGVRFANAATTVPFTLPAHSSMMTGTYPPFHGVRENVGYTLGAEPATLAEVLSAGGYRTAAFVSSFVLDARWGIGRGFDLYHDEFDAEAARGQDLGSVQRDGAETVATASAWLEQDDGTPFFLWLHLFDPHDPYEPAEPFASRYPGRPYDAEVAYTDSLIGSFRSQLERQELLDGSLLIVTGDHGEGLGDHGEGFHGFFVYDSTTHVPLIVRAPGVASGQVVTAAASHVDLLPTILEVAGVAAPDSAQGRSLVPLLLGVEEPGIERVAYTESYYPLAHYGWAPLRALRDARHKLIEAPRPELYEIPTDPGEMQDLSGQRAATLVDLQRRLQALESAIAFEGERREAAADLDEDTLRQLRALGYIAGRGGIDLDAPDDLAGRADPKDKVHLHRLIMTAQSLTGRGDETAAEAALREVLDADPEILDANQMLGNIVGQRGEHDQALLLFQRALAIDPEHVPSLFGLAAAYRNLGRVDDALVGFRRLLEINPADSKGVIGASEILAERGELEAAGGIIERALEAETVPPILYNQLGELRVLQGRAHEADDLFRRAIEANDDLAQPRFNLAVLHEERGQVPRAMELYTQAITRAPGHYQALFNLGRLHGVMGDTGEQTRLYEAAIEANPDFARGYFLLGKLIMDSGGDLRRAEEVTRTGIDRDPEHRAGPLGYYLLADILNRTGRRAEAQAAAQRGRAIQQGAHE